MISQTEAEGVDIENWAGTITNANISSNALSDTGDVATPGSAVTLIGSGLATSAANITRATIANNTIIDFRAGVGVQVRAGNPNAGAPTGSAGTAGSATNVIAITGNSMNGGNAGIGNQPDRFFTGGVSGNGGQGNFNVSNNGTAANRIRNIDCIAIEMQVDGPVTMTSTVQNNFINANSAVGCAGIAVGTDDPNDLGAGTHSTLISGNNVMGTDGPGHLPDRPRLGQHDDRAGAQQHGGRADRDERRAGRDPRRLRLGAGRHDAVPGDQRQHHGGQHEHRHRHHVAGDQPAQAGHRPRHQHVRHRGHGRDRHARASRTTSTD